MIPHSNRSKQTAYIPTSGERHEIAYGGERTSAGGGVAQVASAPPPKQIRTTKGSLSKKNKNVFLSGLLKLPIELFTRIMHDLRPIDILTLSRTCKPFRNILMRRSSASIWKRAAENLPYDLPPCPPWLDMPQYISVVYTNACSACGGKASPKKSKGDLEFHPILLVRLCKTCQPNVLIRAEDIPKQLRELVMIAHVNIVPGPGATMSSGDYALRTQVQKIENDYKRHKERFRHDYDFSDGYSSDSYFSADDFFWEWMSERRGIIEDYPTGSYWYLIQYVEEDRERQKNDLKQQFQRGVESRLKGLGWEHDIDDASGKEWSSLVGQPRNLTDRIWDNLYPKLQPILEKVRERRLGDLPFWKHKHLINLWEGKYHDLGTRSIVYLRHASTLESVGLRLAPPVFEAMGWPCVKKTMDLCQSHHDVKNRLLENWEDIRLSSETWQRDVESKLANRLQSDALFAKVYAPSSTSLVIFGQPVSEDLNVLLRADSVFQFTDNTIRYFPDDFLGVYSSTKPWILDNHLATNSLVVEGAQSFTLARELARTLLRYLGHPDATHLSLRTYGRRFVCGACVDYDAKYANLYDWKGLLNHYVDASLTKLNVSNNLMYPAYFAHLYVMRLPHDPELQVATGKHFQPSYILSVDDARKSISELSAEAPWWDYKEKHACLHCAQYKASDFLAVLTHIQDAHQVMYPEAHRDYENYEAFIRHSLKATYGHQN
ncbi:unnamed protein product [Rhizoctonia solani]|uniref:F-box domain-containing protein n=1 Tax=Rhizoctonia solani TaxID=456999 RepID=A0A8H3D470_9AGAM|nr:unnamed protein product [Rhizoctonia solani]